MGSSSSKTRRFDGASSSCSSFSSSVSSLSVVDGAGSSNGTNRKRLRVRSVFQSSCLGSTSRTCDSDDENQIPNHGHEENGVAVYGHELQRDELVSDEMKMEYFRNLKVEQPDEMACVSSNVDLNEWIQNDRDTSRSANSSPPPASSSQPLNLSSRFRSCFSMAPGNVSFRLSRANSLRSSREESHLPARPSIGAFDRHENQGDSHFHPNLSSTSPRQYHSGPSVNLPMNPPTSTSASSSLDCYPNFSTRSLVRDNISRRTRGDVCSPYSRSHEMQNAAARHADGRNAAREPMNRNSRFSRTLSVGRLRDRVLRRPSFSDLTFPPLQQERVATDSNEVHGINGSTVETRTNTADENPVVSFPSSYQVYGSQNLDNELSELRESRLPDILQQRSSFLERQRRIRSRVRALQRSRFETLSGHERSCILSGHHRTGRCTCHMNARGPNSNDDTGARASISRIVMLAEALFEVLDEIHQQSVALPSQPSVSSIGSIPAPVEVVESLPSKTYSKSTKFKSDEDGQCYICLVEYEDGDDMRILPCHHEFHRACVDKWLKEIHRVCPLCRGDICRSRSSLTES